MKKENQYVDKLILPMADLKELVLSDDNETELI